MLARNRGWYNVALGVATHAMLPNPRLCDNVFRLLRLLMEIRL